MSGPGRLIAPRDLRRRARLALHCLRVRRWTGAQACPRLWPSRIPRTTGSCTRSARYRGTNRIAAAFYDGPTWARFRPWERLFLWFQGPGPARARRQVLRHLARAAASPGARSGDRRRREPAAAAIAAGTSTAWTSPGRNWRPAATASPDGRDGSSGRRRRHLPFEDETFDAVFTVGGFNYFRDHAAALREMRRVARREAPVLVADEIPDLYRFAPGHALGFDALDRWGLRAMGLDPDFIAMVFGSSHRHRRAGAGRVARAPPLPDLEPSRLLSGGPDPRRRPPFSREVLNHVAGNATTCAADWRRDLDTAALRGLRRRVEASRATLWSVASCGTRVTRSATACSSSRRSPTDDNRIAADFYNGPLWPKFRFWEWFFFVCNGGERRSRDVILRHLPRQPGPEAARRGDRRRRLRGLAAGRLEHRRHRRLDRPARRVPAAERRPRPSAGPGRSRGLAVPRPDSSTRSLSIGGFNHFNDPEGALREMVRVVRPGGTIVISDELPNLTDRMIGRKLGLPGFDRWVVSRLMHLGDAFTDLVERHRTLDIDAIGRRVLKNCRYEVIWRGGGYLMVGQAP